MRAITLAAVVIAVAGCSRAPEDKIHGWPPPPEAFHDTLPAPDTWEPPDTAQAEPEDTSPPDPDALPADPCEAVVVLACRFYGEFSDECHEARTREPDGRDPETRVACGELVERFGPGGEESESRYNPCRRYSRRVCRELGRHTQACQRASRIVSRLLRAREKRACLGDLLIFEARALRHR